MAILVKKKINVAGQRFVFIKNVLSSRQNGLYLWWELGLGGDVMVI